MTSISSEEKEGDEKEIEDPMKKYVHVVADKGWAVSLQDMKAELVCFFSNLYKMKN